MAQPKYTSTKHLSSSPSNASIQAYYKPVDRRSSEQPHGRSSTVSGDGFTQEEVMTEFNPLNCNIDPNIEYESCAIGHLVPGPRAVTFAGRIVNISTMYGRDAKHPKAAGWHTLIIKDNSGAIGVGHNI